MFRVIEQVFIGLFSFSESLATKSMSVKNEPFMTRPVLFDINPFIFTYYPFMISLDECNRSCNNAIDDLSAKVCVPSKTTDINFKIFNMITRMNKTKAFVKRLECHSKCKFDKYSM